MTIVFRCKLWRCLGACINTLQEYIGAAETRFSSSRQFSDALYPRPEGRGLTAPLINRCVSTGVWSARKGLRTPVALCR